MVTPGTRNPSKPRLMTCFRDLIQASNLVFYETYNNIRSRYDFQNLFEATLRASPSDEPVVRDNRPNVVPFEIDR
jgi:hypothetical protein